MAANTCTSTTATVASADPVFTVTKSMRNREDGCFLYLKYTLGTSASIAITIATKCLTSSITATDAYSIVSLSGSALSALSYTISAAGNYKIPIPLSQYDDTIIVTITYNAAAQSGAVVANILDV